MKITVEIEERTYSAEISDQITIEEFYEAFFLMAVALTFTPNTIEDFIISKGEELNESTEPSIK